MNSFKLPSISNLPPQSLSIFKLAPLNIKTQTYFNCSECPKKFTRKSSLRRHFKKHIGSEPFWCKSCDKCFTRTDTFLKHKESRNCALKARNYTRTKIENDCLTRSPNLYPPSPSSINSKMSISWLLSDSSDNYNSSDIENSHTNFSNNYYSEATLLSLKPSELVSIIHTKY